MGDGKLLFEQSVLVAEALVVVEGGAQAVARRIVAGARAGWEARHRRGLGAELVDFGSQLGVAVEELAAHSRGGRDGGKVDLRAGCRDCAQRLADAGSGVGGALRGRAPVDLARPAT